MKQRNYQSEDEALPCWKCSGYVERRRRPITLRDLLLLMVPLVFGWASLLSLRDPFGEPYRPEELLVEALVGLLPLVMAVLGSRRYCEMLRCTDCWRPQGQTTQHSWDFWFLYSMSFSIFASKNITDRFF